MQATKAEYSNYFSVPWKIQPLSQEQKKNPAEEFFTSSTNPQKHLQTIYIPKIPVLALGWCFASSLLQHLDDPKFLGFSPKKKLFNRSQGRNSSSLANHSGRWGWAALPGDLGLDSLPLAQFQKLFPKEFLCRVLWPCLGWGPPLFMFIFLIKRVRKNFP